MELEGKRCIVRKYSPFIWGASLIILFLLTPRVLAGEVEPAINLQQEVNLQAEVMMSGMEASFANTWTGGKHLNIFGLSLFLIALGFFLGTLFFLRGMRRANRILRERYILEQESNGSPEVKKKK